MLRVPTEEIGQTYRLEGDIESQSIDSQSIDLKCYCGKCCYKRRFGARVVTNFNYGMLFFPFWILNVLFYLKSIRLDSDYEFSEDILANHRDEITLFQPDSTSDEDSLIGKLVMSHKQEQKSFDRWIYWSGMGLVLYLVLCWYLIMILTASHG